MDLLPHNRKAYNAVEEALETSSRTCVIHPTGTGKSYIAMAYIEAHPDQRILFITSYLTTLSRFAADCKKNIPGAFSHLDLTIYSGLAAGNLYDPDALTNRYTSKKLAARKLADYDAIILDEFHRCGANTWEEQARNLIEGCITIGFSATPIRFLDDNRDMGKEIFYGNVASEITLHDALVDKLLPTPQYITCRYSLWEDFAKAEGELKYKWMTDQEKREAADILMHARNFLQNAEGLDLLFSTKMRKPHGRYIVFCRDSAHLRSMRAESRDWFDWAGEIHYYTMLAGSGNAQRELSRFERDDSDALKLLFCVDMLNEGVHIPSIDGIIMLRPTQSMIVYLQQLGRALSVDTGERMDRNDRVQIFDIVNNARELEQGKQFWNGVIADFAARGERYEDAFDVFSRDLEFDRLIMHLDKFKHVNSWDYNYELCKQFYEEHGHLNVTAGTLVDGHNIYLWLNHQKHAYADGTLSEEKIKKLEMIGIQWEIEPRKSWAEWIRDAEEYHSVHGDLNVPKRYKCKDGTCLWVWLQRVRELKRCGELSDDTILMLENMGIIWETKTEGVEPRWMRSYNILLDYMQENDTNDVPVNCIWKDFKLGQWMVHVRYQFANQDNPDFSKKKLSEEKIELLIQSGVELVKDSWMKIFNAVREYKELHKNTDFPKDWEVDGINVKTWWIRQRQVRLGTVNGILSPERIALLDSIGYEWRTGRETMTEERQRRIGLCRQYYRENGDLDVPVGFKIGEDDLGRIVRLFRAHKDQLSETEIRQLEAVGMIWSRKTVLTEQTTETWEKYCAALERYKARHGNCNVPRAYDNSKDPENEELPGNLYVWASNQVTKRNYRNKHPDEPVKKERMLTDYQIKKLTDLGFFEDWDAKKKKKQQEDEEICRLYVAMGKPSIKKFVTELKAQGKETSVTKAKKALITAGLLRTERGDEIRRIYEKHIESGMRPTEAKRKTAAELGITESTVKGTLPGKGGAVR